jgi:hypothetical protein
MGSLTWYNAQAINLSLGNGDGTFKPANSTNVAAPSLLQLVTGDFNDDGKLDAVALEETGSRYNAQLYLGNGDGTLTESGYAESSGDYRTNYVAVADFNRDGFLDLYVTGDDLGSQWFSIFLGDGRGNFTQSFNYTVAQVAGYGAAAIGDFNGDGIIDLAVPNVDNFGYEVFLGNGDGSFRNPISTGSAETPFPVAADMNGDGILDLVDGGCIQLGNGDGTFQYPGGDQCEYNGPVVGVGGVGDFDGDRNFDAALTQGYPAGTAILLGDGKGHISGSWFFSVSATYPPVIGDFNNDGKLDLLLQNGYVLQQIGPSATPPR